MIGNDSEVIMIRVLVLAIAMTRAFARVNLIYSNYAKLKKYRGLQTDSRQIAGALQAIESRTVVEMSLIRV